MFSALLVLLIQIYCLLFFYSNSSFLFFLLFFFNFHGLLRTFPNSQTILLHKQFFIFLWRWKPPKWYISLSCTNQMAFYNSMPCTTFTDGSFPVLWSFCQGTGWHFRGSTQVFIISFRVQWTVMYFLEQCLYYQWILSNQLQRSAQTEQKLAIVTC